jgi:glucose/arabinose dehydrogenase
MPIFTTEDTEGTEEMTFAARHASGEYDGGMMELERLESRRMLAALPAGFSESVVASGLAAPTAMGFSPDGRLFVAEQGGALRVIKNGQLLAQPFVQLNVDSRVERGLLGVAFHPRFHRNGYVYVYYTVPAGAGTAAHNRVSLFVAQGDVAVPGSERVILELDPLSRRRLNHNGGGIAFGPDLRLYVGTGENAIPSNATSLTTRLGKILRINPDGSIPRDNPFYTRTSGVNKAIWAIGLRNPFSFAFDRASGKMLINDVGQRLWEEINLGVTGANYGWPATEGPTNRSGIRAPLFAYGHGSGATTGDAIVGSAFYSPSVRTFGKRYAGDYFFADLSSGWIRRMDEATGQVVGFASGVEVPVALAVNDRNGSLWYLERGFGGETGRVVRVQRTGVGAAAVSSAVFSTKVIEERQDVEEEESVFDSSLASCLGSSGIHARAN